MSYNFEASRLVTRGINKKINLEFQSLLWSLLDEQVTSEAEMDYIQIFEIFPNATPKIVHRQEQPERSVTVYFMGITGNLDSVTVWIIAEDQYVKMLLPEEY